MYCISRSGTRTRVGRMKISCANLCTNRPKKQNKRTTKNTSALPSSNDLSFWRNISLLRIERRISSSQAKRHTTCLQAEKGGLLKNRTVCSGNFATQKFFNALIASLSYSPDYLAFLFTSRLS